MEKVSNSTKKRTLIYKCLIYILLVFGAIVVVSPLYFMVIWSSWDVKGVFQFPPKYIFGPYLLENLRFLIEEVYFLGMLNSTFIATVNTLLAIFFCTLGGFAFAKYKFRGKEVLFVFLLATMAIPFQITLVPLFIIMLKLHWINTYYAVIVPSIANAFGVFFMRQSIQATVPDELLDAARIDGVPEFGLYGRIVLPVILPSIAAFGIISFMSNWNAYIWPLIVLRTREMQTLPVVLSRLTGIYYKPWGSLMLGTTLSVIPPLILFLSLQKYFIKGIILGAFR